MGADNRPKKGSIIKVDPIRDTKDIKNIKRLLADRPRDLAIFITGINTNLRASDLLKIRVGQICHLQPGEHFTVREKKTKKLKNITINKTVLDAMKNLLATMPECTDDTFLFLSRKGENKPLNVATLHKMVSGWCAEINLRGNYGSHTLRKTFGYVHRTVFGTDIPTLMTMFNHSTQRQTLTYLGIQEEEIKDAYLREI